MWVGEGEGRDRVEWLDGEVAVAGSQGCRRGGTGREVGRDGTPVVGEAEMGLIEKTGVGQVVQGIKGSTVLGER